MPDQDKESFKEEVEEVIEAVEEFLHIKPKREKSAKPAQKAKTMSTSPTTSKPKPALASTAPTLVSPEYVELVDMAPAPLVPAVPTILTSPPLDSAGTEIHIGDTVVLEGIVTNLSVLDPHFQDVAFTPTKPSGVPLPPDTVILNRTPIPAFLAHPAQLTVTVPASTKAPPVGPARVQPTSAVAGSSAAGDLTGQAQTKP